jgi:FkbM family methyltransferase
MGCLMIGRLLRRTPFVGTEEQAYQRLSAKGYRPTTIIDVGAYEGNWTRLARRVFPNCASLMIEPQASKAPLLQQLAGTLPRTRFVSALLADEPGHNVTFYEMETGSSMLPENSDAPRQEVHLTTSTLDEVATDLSGSIFLKIDAQGAELKILAGATQTLPRCDVIQLEVALQAYNAGAPEFLETVSAMKQQGFIPYDFSGFSRPNGFDLVQVDIVFVREDSSLRPTFFEFS